jgi:uncharacterized membrane protein HdeD (DUF308 family)
MAKKGEKNKSKITWGKVFVFNGICLIFISIIILIFMLERTLITYSIATFTLLFGIYLLIDGILTLKK